MHALPTRTTHHSGESPTFAIHTRRPGSRLNAENQATPALPRRPPSPRPPGPRATCCFRRSLPSRREAHAHLRLDLAAHAVMYYGPSNGAIRSNAGLGPHALAVLQILEHFSRHDPLVVRDRAQTARAIVHTPRQAAWMWRCDSREGATITARQCPSRLCGFRTSESPSHQLRGGRRSDIHPLTCGEQFPRGRDSHC
jgi:hypothetical protein